MAAGQIQIKDTGLTINTDDYWFQRFALEVAEATKRHLDEINEVLGIKSPSEDSKGG